MYLQENPLINYKYTPVYQLYLKREEPSTSEFHTDTVSKTGGKRFTLTPTPHFNLYNNTTMFFLFLFQF